MKKIGMRNIKTAIAVSLSLAVSRLLKTEYPFYTAIAAIISMQNSLVGSFRVGKNRMLGTTVGASVGLIFLLISPGNIILSGVGIVVVIYICDLLDWNKAINIACVVFCIIMTNLSGKNPFIYSFSRILDTFIGIIIAVVINYIIKPPNNAENFFKVVEETEDKIFKFVELIIIKNRKIDLSELESLISKNEKLYAEYKDEIDLVKDKVNDDSKIKDRIKILKDVFFDLRILASLDGMKSINRDNYEKLVNIYGYFQRESEEKISETYYVFNYHLSNIIEKFYLMITYKNENNDEI
jgi:uncharacterized membrane protein YgaE (UPF0421/DUF939 family)